MDDIRVTEYGDPDAHVELLRKAEAACQGLDRRLHLWTTGAHSIHFRRGVNGNLRP